MTRDMTGRVIDAIGMLEYAKLMVDHGLDDQD